MTTVRPIRRMAGFTLVETMVVVAVLFLLAAIGIPAYQGYLETARQERIVTVVHAFAMFEQNWYIESDPQSYFAGSYAPGANDFEAIGYEVSGGSDSVKFTVSGGASCGGDITRCYKVVAQDIEGGAVGTFESATNTWTWTTP